MADNFLVKSGAGADLTKASKDIGSGVQADKSVLINGSDSSVVDPANAGNQATQTTAITLVSTRLGDIASPASGSVNYRLGQLVTALGSPLQAGASIGNTSFGISGTLPAFAATPTFNIGTAPTIAVTGTFFQATQPVSAASLPLPTGAATATGVAAVNTTLGSPFQAGGSIGNSSFGISGTLPSFASTQTFNLGTLNGAATAANQAIQITAEQGLVAATGEVQASPTANTVLDRLKRVETGLTALGTKLDTVNTNLTSASGASEVHVGQFGGTVVVSGGSFTRPADTTAYASGDLVANSTTAGSVTPVTISNAARINAGTGRITGVRLSKSGTSLTNASFRVHFFKGTASTPFVAVANGDNGALSPNTVAALHIGYIDVVMDVPGSDGAKGAGAPARNLLTFDAAAGRTSLYAMIEARAAYTPTSGETFTIAAEIDQD